MSGDFVTLLAFMTAGQHFVLDVHRVRELVRSMPLVPALGASSCLLGHMVLRGEVLPVLDLACALHAGSPQKASTAPFGPQTGSMLRPAHILVLDVLGHSVGLMVDRVLEVLRMPKSSLKADASPISLRVQHCFGLCDVRGVPHLMLDVRPLLGLANDGPKHEQEFL